MDQNELLQELECPICFNYLKPPIRLCHTGHSICDPCRRKLNMCPICKLRFSNGRNLALETIAYKVKYPCPFKEKGCQASILYDEQELHVYNCRYKAIDCPQGGCSFKGELSELVQHCETEHQAVTPMNGDIDFDLISFRIRNEDRSNILIKIFNQYFWFRGKIISDSVHFVVQLLGKHEDAFKYKYKFVISQGERKTYFEDTCKSIYVDDANTFTYINSCFLSLQAYEFYFSCPQTLTIEKIMSNSDTNLSMLEALNALQNLP